MSLTILSLIAGAAALAVGVAEARIFSKSMREKRVISVRLILGLTVTMAVLTAFLYVAAAVSLSALHGSPPETSYIGWLMLLCLTVLPAACLVFLRLLQQIGWNRENEEHAGRTRLVLASASVVFLVLWGAAVTVLGGRLAMILAMERNDVAVVKKLLSAGISPDMKMVITGEVHRPLHYAAYSGSGDMARLLLAAGADVRAEDALTDAVVSGTPEVVQILLQAGADPNQGSGYSSPLVRAVERRSARTVQLLLDHGARIDFITTRDLTALDVAREKGYGEIADLLLGRGAREKLTSPQREMALFAAAEKQDLPGMLKLLDKGTNVDCRDSLNQTPLIHAITYGKPEAALWLLDHGANPDIRDVNERNALWYAAEKGLPDVARRLLSRGPFIESFDRYRKTALMAACEQGNLEVAKLLLAHGADAGLRYGDSAPSALDLARGKNHTEVVRLLLAHGAGEAPGNTKPLKTGH